jgi:predicted metal-dependent phosphoesterase TrpH
VCGSLTTDVDMHVKVLNEQVITRAKRCGLDVLVYAPHFRRWPTIRERAERFSDDELLIVPARELFTGTWRTRKHLLALGLSAPIPDFLTLEGTVAELRRQTAIIAVPHPEFLNVSLDRDEITQREDVVATVETHNAKLLPQQNRRCRDVATHVENPVFGSSYAHIPSTVGEVWTRFERDMDEEADLLAALRDGDPRRVMRRSGAVHHLRGLAEFAHLGYENSWQKLDRLFLSGTEPTHPNHIAYEGRFDDVSVY